MEEGGNDGNRIDEGGPIASEHQRNRKSVGKRGLGEAENLEGRHIERGHGDGQNRLLWRLSRTPHYLNHHSPPH